jgi:hypothetical protein
VDDVTDETLDRLAELAADAATWLYQPCRKHAGTDEWAAHACLAFRSPTFAIRLDESEVAPFVNAARNALPALLAELRRRRAEAGPPAAAEARRCASGQGA